MLHEILAFSSREALCNRLSALFFMTASVSFYQAFFPATDRAFCGLLWSWIWCSLAKLKQQIMKTICWPASKGLRLSTSAELTGYGSIMSIHQGLTDGMEAHWNYLDGKQHPRLMGFPKPGRDAVRPCGCCPASSMWPQDFHLWQTYHRHLLGFMFSYKIPDGIREW